MRPPTPHCHGTPYCPHPVQRRGLCHHHLKEAEAREHPNAAFYRSARWVRLRARILRLEPHCRQCHATATEVDHITPIEEGGAPLDPANLQPLCKPCHSKKTATERAARSSSPG